MALTVWIRILASLLALSLLPAWAEAQNIPGVFGPTVDAGDAEFELRYGLAPDEDGDWASESRLHYQRAFDDRFRFRGVVQVFDGPQDPPTLEHIQLELLWQTVERARSGYESALRFDLRALRDRDRPDRLRVNWIHQWRFGEGWRLRTIGLFAHEIGPGAGDGVSISLRSRLSRRWDSGLQLGVEGFSSLGNTTAGLGQFDDQRHTLGPMVRVPLVAGWDGYVGVQLGLSERARNEAWQLRVTRRF